MTVRRVGDMAINASGTEPVSRGHGLTGHLVVNRGGCYVPPPPSPPAAPGTVHVEVTPPMSVPIVDNVTAGGEYTTYEMRCLSAPHAPPERGARQPARARPVSRLPRARAEPA